MFDHAILYVQYTAFLGAAPLGTCQVDRVIGFDVFVVQFLSSLFNFHGL